MSEELKRIREKKIKEMLRKKRKPGIKVYTTFSCPYCQLAKDFLKRKGLEFKEINVESDQKAALEMIEKSGQMGVPVIDINGTIIIGFNQPAIEKALNRIRV